MFFRSHYKDIQNSSDHLLSGGFKDRVHRKL